MKKIVSIIAAIMLFIALVPINAFAASGSMSGPSVARAGDTINVTFNVSGGNFYGYTGTLSYDASVLSLQGVSSNASGNWSFSRNGNNLLGYNQTGNNNPISSVFTATFKVNSGVSEGTAINVSFSGIFSGNGSEVEVSGSYSGKVAAPLSGDATLSSLMVANAKLSPAFSPNVTSYSCGTVGFEVAKLSVSAKAKENGAKVSINGSNLSVGDNKVYIVVTAPNGAKKTYTITATRQQDPNYVPSKNANLAGVTLSTGQLSPEFKADLREYVVYLPYEIQKISIAGSAADPLAKGVTSVTDAKLKIGLNKLSIKCTAEDGTEVEYKFNVVRMNEYEGEKSIVLPNAVDTPVASTTETTTQASSSMSDGVSPILLAVLGLACLLLGFAIGMIIFKNKKPKDKNDFGPQNPNDEDDIDEEVMKYFDK